MPLCKVITILKKKKVFSGVLETKNSRNCCLREWSSVFSSQTPRLMIFKTGISLTFLSRECIILSHLKSSFRGTLIGPVWRLRSRSTDTQLRRPTPSSGDLQSQIPPADDAYNYHLLSTSLPFCTDSFNLQECYFSHLTDNWNFG